MKSMSYYKRSWSRSGVSVPSANTTDLKLQAETLMQQIYCTSKPLYAGERPCPRSQTLSQNRGKMRTIHCGNAIRVTGFKILVANTDLESLSLQA